MQSTAEPPRVTVGLPVFNGENYLGEALQSLANQDFQDFEVIIGDNGSTDRTEEICRDFVERFPRATYLRSPENRGAAWNYNRLVAPAQGEYFIWMAHDDIFAPSLLGKCVEVLDASPDAVLCTPGVQDIDGDGTPYGRWQLGSPVGSKDPWRRFIDVVRRPQYQQSFSLIRKSVLEQTPLFGAYIGADGVLLAELALYGLFSEIPEPLFLNRQHALSSTEAYPTYQGRNSWWDPRLEGKIAFPVWRLLGEQFKAVWRAPLSPSDRFQATLELISWAVVSWKSLAGSFVWAGRQVYSRRRHLVKA